MSSGLDDNFLARAINGEFEPKVTRLDGLKALEDLAENSLSVGSACALMIGTIAKNVDLPQEARDQITTLAAEVIDSMVSVAGLIAPLQARLKQESGA